MVSHDTAAVEEHNRHQKDGENDHTESRAEQGNTYPGNGQWIVEEAQQLPACGDQECACHAACNAADAA